MNETVPIEADLPRSLRSLTDTVDNPENFFIVVDRNKHLVDEKSRSAMSVSGAKSNLFKPLLV